MFKIKNMLSLLIIAAAGLMLTGCSISADGHDFSINVGNNEKEYSSDEITLNNVTAVSTDISVNVGSVSIEYSDSDTVEIDIDYTAEGRDEDHLTEILDKAKVKAEVIDDELVVSVVNKDTDQNIWTWIEKEYHSLNNRPNLDVDLDIKLPTSVQKFNVSTNVGDIDLDSLQGSFDITSNVGAINADNLLFTEDSEIRSDVGDITCSLSDQMKEACDISIVTNVGKIDLDTNGLDYTEENVDHDNLVGCNETVSIEDFCTIDAQISVGKLNID